jgi:phosphatidylserine/phosphatidylglycerophosphate/cardiolipin synthase-like enzyme
MPKRSSPLIKGRAATLLFFVIAAFLLCQFLTDPDFFVIEEEPTAAIVVDEPTPLPNDTPSGGTETSSITVYFTDPLAANAKNKVGGADEQVAKAIRNAKSSVDMAMYNLSLPSIGDALLDAHARGVRVRLVMESESMDGDVPQELIEAGIEIVGDGRQGLMHNKFTIIDGEEVWMGSLNLTSSNTYSDFNNLVRFRSKRMAQNYTKEFEEMFNDNLFGPADLPETPNPVISLGGGTVETYFSPDDGVAQHLVQLIESADESIYFLAYSFTSDEIAQAMLDRMKAGVEVRGVMDESQYKSNTGTEYDVLRKAGADVRLDSIPGLLHHKVIIVDGKAVAFGSYNFSRNAEKINDENMVIVFNPTIAQKFVAEFERIFAISK